MFSIQPAEEDRAALAWRGWLLAGLTERTHNHTFFCQALPALAAQLQQVYASSFRDGLAFSRNKTVGAVETVLSSGHDTLLSVLYWRALDQLYNMAVKAGCGKFTALLQARNAIGVALNGPLLWNESSGMFRPSSYNNANLTDVWGSALAVDAGLVTDERAARIVRWFGAHWSEVVQDGQIRHLPLVGRGVSTPSHCNLTCLVNKPTAYNSWSILRFLLRIDVLRSRKLVALQRASTGRTPPHGSIRRLQTEVTGRWQVALCCQ